MMMYHPAATHCCCDWHFQPIKLHTTHELGGYLPPFFQLFINRFFPGLVAKVDFFFIQDRLPLPCFAYIISQLTATAPVLSPPLPIICILLLNNRHLDEAQPSSSHFILYPAGASVTMITTDCRARWPTSLLWGPYHEPGMAVVDIVSSYLETHAVNTWTKSNAKCQPSGCVIQLNSTCMHLQIKQIFLILVCTW